MPISPLSYRIGFRIEPRDRTGFAHLFEHMMFRGSKNLGKMEFIKLVQQNGGVLNGSTRFDFTNYLEVLPSNKLETVLRAEADRMSGLAVTDENLKNQQGVVGNEVQAGSFLPNYLAVSYNRRKTHLGSSKPHARICNFW